MADGRWTIGYGHTLTAREGAEVSEQDAEALLIYDLIAVAHSVNEWTFTPLTQNQFDALTAFAFNIGLDNFRRSSVLRRLNEGALIQAACAMELWRKADFEGERIVIDALVRRRSAEKTLFLTPTDGFVPVPSPILRPNVDMDSAGIVPRRSPAVVVTPMDGAHAFAQREEPAPTPVVPEEEQGPSPTQAAAAAVSSRLAAIFSDQEPEAAADAAIPAEPTRLVIEEPSDEPAQAEAFPVEEPAETASEDSFTLTAPNEDAEAFAEPALEDASSALPEGEPTLFDETTAAANDSLPLPEPEVAKLEVGDAAFEPRPRIARDTASLTARPAKLGILPSVALAVAGIVLFGGCLFWAINVPPQAGAGVLNPAVIVWLAGIVGVGLVGVAVYLLLERLGRAGLAENGDLDRDE